jgi:putative radical SAM enzyme (TIGR03279 family)
MRKSLYVMDDDYRFSFSDGNFITLTNLKPYEWRRIYQLKLSPLYISVHSTNPYVREKMLKNHKARDIIKQLKNLSKHDIYFHCQIVLCYGYNDKDELDKTISDLEQLIPHMSGIAIVPSGLSQFRKNLTYLKAWDKDNSIKVIKQVKKWQKYFRQKYNKTLVYLADEFYYLSEIKLPPSKYYDGFYYTEDGIGTTRLFFHTFEKNKKYIPKKIDEKRKVTIICGEIAGKYLQEKVDVLNKVENLKVQLIPIENKYFGKGITVTGLLTATDIISSLKNVDIGNELIIPSVVLRKEDKVFLDNYKVEDVEKALNTKIKICEMGAKNFIEASLGFKI